MRVQNSLPREMVAPRVLETDDYESLDEKV